MIPPDWLALSGEHTYLALTMLVLLEGPVATLLAGSLIGSGLLVPVLTALCVVGADLSADGFVFALGRLGRHDVVARQLQRLGLSPARRRRLAASFDADLPRALLGAKVLDIAALPVIFAAGLSGVRPARFLAWDFAFTVPKSSLLLGVGAVLGASLPPTTAWVGVPLLVGAALLLHLLVRAIRAHPRQGVRT